MRARSLSRGMALPIVLCTAGLTSARVLASDPPIVRVSTPVSSTQADGESTGAAISVDGRYVAFVSRATNLVPDDFNNLGDVFVRDLQTGTLVSASRSPSGAGSEGESHTPALSADGRLVAFVSEAWNLVLDDGNGTSDVFVRDLVSGAIVRASISVGGADPNGESANPCFSADGGFLAFESRASNLVAGDSNGEHDIFLRDLAAGTIERVSLTTGGGEALQGSRMPALSSDGRWIAFASAAENLTSAPENTNACWDIFVRDRVAGTTVLVSLSTSGSQATGTSSAPAISAEGRYVAFESTADDLVPTDTNDRCDVYVRDLLLGTTSRISVGAGGLQGNGASTHPSISGDGRFVAFVSKATNLVGDDTNCEQDVFVHDRQTATTTRHNLGPSGLQAQRKSLWVALSEDGRFLAFPSADEVLVPGDSNGEVDVFRRGPLF